MKKRPKRKIKKYLEEFVYGATDGSITTFAVVAGALGASLKASVVIILGFANLFADGFSMAISSYLSSRSHEDLHKTEDHKKTPTKKAIATFLSFVVIGFIPLITFVASLFYQMSESSKFIYTIILTGVAFIIIGYIKGNITKKNKILSSLESLFIGGTAAAIAYLVGYFLRGLA
ncbi:MAG: hypothetical protein D6767_08310 [Candidatus Hydrogenedentota bacterium]|nr:MAG: hypothetical protein D6767_08310 [Candidatus Hydrogenedentota bacterium]